MRDLWPDDIKPVALSITPLGLLNEQASLLSDKASGLQAEVRHIGGGSLDNEFVYAFVILAPTLNDYRYTLFTIKHDINIYPTRVCFNASFFEATSEDEFINILEKVLCSEHTRKVLGTLLSMIGDKQ